MMHLQSNLIDHHSDTMITLKMYTVTSLDRGTLFRATPLTVINNH